MPQIGSGRNKAREIIPGFADFIRSSTKSSRLAAPASAATAAAGTAAPGTSTAAVAAATAAPLGLRPRFIDDEIAVTEEAPVQHLDCFLGFLFGRHLHEPEAPRPAGELVGDDPDRLDGAGLGEELAKILLRGLEGQVSDEQLSGHRCDLLPTLTRAY